MKANNDGYLKRLVETLKHQTKAYFRGQFTGLGGGAYSEFFWKRIQYMSAETLGKIVSCANIEDLKRSQNYQGNVPTDGQTLMMRTAHAVLYRQYVASVFGV
jgi:hypothetical protein